MESGLVGDDHMQGQRIGVGYLFEKTSVYFPVDGGGEELFGFVLAVDLQCLVQIDHLYRVVLYHCPLVSRLYV